MTDRIVRPRPYRRFMRNVHIRRAIVLFAGPIVLLLLIPVAAAMGIREGVSTFFNEAVTAIKDGNSYD